MRIARDLAVRTKQHGSRKPPGNKTVHTHFDWKLVGVIIFLALFGVLMVYDSSVAISIRDFGDRFHFVVDQMRWLIIGIIVCFFISRYDYHKLHLAALPLLLTTVAFLLFVFIPGFGVKALGAHRWLNFRLFVLQPAELAKLTLVLYLSAWLSHPEKGRFASFLLLLGSVFGLVVIEPDLGTAMIILGIALSLYFLSGARVSHFLVLMPLLVAGIVGLAVISPYRFARLTTFLHPEKDPLGSSYQIRQVLLGLGSGGIFGLGIGQSRQKYEYLPEANTDSIFAIIGEETGFVGAVIMILSYVFLLWRGFLIAIRAPDTFGKLLAAGITTWIAIQSTLNLAAMVALVPLTGIPLPLISYGGSSLVIALTGMGILLNISRNQKI